MNFHYRPAHCRRNLSNFRSVTLRD